MRTKKQADGLPDSDLSWLGPFLSFYHTWKLKSVLSVHRGILNLDLKLLSPAQNILRVHVHA